MSPYLSRAQLRRRGWGQALLERLTPDANRVTAAGRVLFLFDCERIERLEAQPFYAKRIAASWRARALYAQQKLAQHEQIAGAA